MLSQSREIMRIPASLQIKSSEAQKSFNQFEDIDKILQQVEQISIAEKSFTPTQVTSLLSFYLGNRKDVDIHAPLVVQDRKLTKEIDPDIDSDKKKSDNSEKVLVTVFNRIRDKQNDRITTHEHGKFLPTHLVPVVYKLVDGSFEWSLLYINIRNKNIVINDEQKNIQEVEIQYFDPVSDSQYSESRFNALFYLNERCEIKRVPVPEYYNLTAQYSGAWVIDFAISLATEKTPFPYASRPQNKADKYLHYDIRISHHAHRYHLKSFSDILENVVSKNANDNNKNKISGPEFATIDEKKQDKLPLNFDPFALAVETCNKTNPILLEWLLGGGGANFRKEYIAGSIDKPNILRISRIFLFRGNMAIEHVMRQFISLHSQLYRTHTSLKTKLAQLDQNKQDERISLEAEINKLQLEKNKHMDTLKNTLKYVVYVIERSVLEQFMIIDKEYSLRDLNNQSKHVMANNLPKKFMYELDKNLYDPILLKFKEILAEERARLINEIDGKLDNDSLVEFCYAAEYEWNKYQNELGKTAENIEIKEGFIPDPEIEEKRESNIRRLEKELREVAIKSMEREPIGPTSTRLPKCFYFVEDPANPKCDEQFKKMLVLTYGQLKVDQTNEKGNTLAHEAAFKSQFLVLKILQNYGLDFALKNNDGHNVAQMSSFRTAEEFEAVMNKVAKDIQDNVPRTHFTIYAFNALNKRLKHVYKETWAITRWDFSENQRLVDAVLIERGLRMLQLSLQSRDDQYIYNWICDNYDAIFKSKSPQYVPTPHETAPDIYDSLSDHITSLREQSSNDNNQPAAPQNPYVPIRKVDPYEPEWVVQLKHFFDFLYKETVVPFTKAGQRPQYTTSQYSGAMLQYNAGLVMTIATLTDKLTNANNEIEDLKVKLSNKDAEYKAAQNEIIEAKKRITELEGVKQKPPLTNAESRGQKQHDYDQSQAKNPHGFFSNENKTNELNQSKMPSHDSESQSKEELKK